eukprot:4333305-Amphidinium_carterae.1
MDQLAGFCGQLSNGSCALRASFFVSLVPEAHVIIVYANVVTLDELAALAWCFMRAVGVLPLNETDVAAQQRAIKLDDVKSSTRLRCLEASVIHF